MKKPGIILYILALFASLTCLAQETPITPDQFESWTVADEKISVYIYDVKAALDYFGTDALSNPLPEEVKEAIRNGQIPSIRAQRNPGDKRGSLKQLTREDICSLDIHGECGAKTRVHNLWYRFEKSEIPALNLLYSPHDTSKGIRLVSWLEEKTFGYEYAHEEFIPNADLPKEFFKDDEVMSFDDLVKDIDLARHFVYGKNCDEITHHNIKRADYFVPVRKQSSGATK